MALNNRVCAPPSGTAGNPALRDHSWTHGHSQTSKDGISAIRAGNTPPRLFVPRHDQGHNLRMSRGTVEILTEALAPQRRVAELDSKAVSPIPWAEVRSRLMATLRNER